MTRFNVCATEKVYYLTINIKAENEAKAVEKYVEMLHKGEVLDVNSEIETIKVEPVK